MMEGPVCRVRREARARERYRHCTLDSLKALDPNRPIREADIAGCLINVRFTSKSGHWLQAIMSIRASRDRFADCPFGDKAIRRWRLPSDFAPSVPAPGNVSGRGYDLRPQYRESDLPTTAHVAVTTIEDAYAPAGRVDKAGILHVEAELEPARHATAH